MTEDLAAVAGIAIATLGGAAIGVERQWSGHATGPRARFGGVRTFTLLGGAAGISGLLWLRGFTTPSALLLLGCVGLIVVGYLAASRHDVDATTETAALVVLGAGVLAGAGHLALASGAIAVTNLLLLEKSRLHQLVRRLDDVELRAAARFAVMAVVVLPLLPSGPFGPLGGVRPRELWSFVLILSGLSFAGYLARRVFGPRHGLILAGALGGLVSSTSVALSFSRSSRARPADSGPLSIGVVAASTIMFIRLAVVTTALNLRLGQTLLPLLAGPIATGLLVVGFGLWMRRGGREIEPGPLDVANPLQIGAALQMALLFQTVLFLVTWVRESWGDAGVITTGAILGLTDTDALALAMARTSAGSESMAVAAVAVAAGGLSNTFFKLALSLGLGAPAFRLRAGAGMGLLCAAAALGLVIGYSALG